MAWITVDQKLIGGKMRALAKSIGCSQNEAIGILIRLWLWGIDNVEEDGKIVAGDRTDVGEALLPGFSKEMKGRTDEVVQCLINCQWIEELEGKLYLHDWMDWRTYYNKFVAGKEKHAERMRNYRSSKSSTEPQTTDAKDKLLSIGKNAYTVGFEAFWNVYPRKVDKGNAYKKYQARIKDGYTEEDLLEASKNYGEECRINKTESKFIKHAKTFLSDSMPFTDYIKKPGANEPEKANKAPGGNPFKK